MAAQDNNTNRKTSLLGRLRTAVKKVTFLMNYNINRWRLASLFIHGGGRHRALSSRRMSFNDRLGLTSIMSSPSYDDNSNWASAYATPSYQMSPAPEEGELQKTRSFPLQRTTSFPEEDDIDKRADLFISNFYKQLKMERQISMKLRYKKDTSFESPNTFSP